MAGIQNGRNFMKMITDLFSQIFEMSIIATVVIIAVLLIRFLIGKLPKKYSYYLWSVVLFRLICPVSISSVMSIFNLDGKQLRRFLELTDTSLSGGSYLHIENMIAQEVEEKAHLWLQIVSVLWLVGIVAIAFYSICAYYKLHKVVSKATLLRENVYECENISSPFVMGMFTPKIYIPYHLSLQEQDYVLVHEKYHIKRCDHIVKIIIVTVLAVYWFHPLVWMAYFYANRDMEMSCDEQVLNILGDKIKQEYSLLLLSFATNKRMKFSYPLGFGENDTSKRVKNVLHFQKPHIWRNILGIFVFGIVVLGCGTNEATGTVIDEIGDYSEDIYL